MQTKKSYQYDNNVKEVISILQYKRKIPLIMGSNSYANIYLNGLDYDLYSKIQYKNRATTQLKSEIISWFITTIKRLYFEEDIFFIELIMGKYREKPIKWSYTEINQGYKTIDNTKIFFNEELLKLDTIIKIEIAMFNGIEFIPISNVYEYYIEKQGINQEKETRDDVKKLDDDIRKYSSDEHLNLMKVCKRLFVKALQHKNMSLKNKLILLFKSDIGKLYRVKSEIDCIISVIDMRDNHTKNDNLLQNINDALQNIKSVLSSTQYKFYTWLLA